MKDEIQGKLDIQFDAKKEASTQEPVVCLGIEFENDEARRAYFREELRKKLPVLKQIEGYPIGEDDDIINLSDPPYYTACPNPWLNDFVDEWEKEKLQLEKEGKRKTDFEVKEPYASDVSEGKNNPVYTAHTYHTKVPHPAIMRYILYYTQPGDIVFDGFAGTGMTGVATSACGQQNEITTRIETEWNTLFKTKPMMGLRHAICGDLSPYASLIAYNYNTPIDINILTKEINRIFAEVKEECGWMYKTMHEGKEIGEINCAVWSDVLICNNCGHEFVYWDAAVNHEKQCVLDDFYCPHCNALLSKKDIGIAQESYFDNALNVVSTQTKCIPVYIAYSANGNRFEKTADEYDKELVKKILQLSHNKYFPSSRLPEGGETRRNDKIGITHIHHFYTRRNLLVLSVLLDKIEKSLLPNKLKFIFTGMINRSSKMNRMHINHFFKGGGGWNGGNLKGTLYVPNLPVETSIIEQIQDKLNSFIRASAYLPTGYYNALYVGSADDIKIRDNSIDYIFVDPPFGANISYSELNVLPESWLKVVTNNSHEAIVNEKQNKNASFYLRTMSDCFAEFYRILKPGKWITVEFSNTSAAIWNFLQTSIVNVGFVISNVSALDKKQGSFNAVTTTTAVKQDLVITCYKPSVKMSELFEMSKDKSSNVWDFINELLQHLPVHVERNQSTTVVVERSPKILYDRLISYYVQHGYAVPMDATDFQTGLRERYVERDGMFFTADQAAQYEKKRNELPNGVQINAFMVGSEADGIQWLKNKLYDGSKTYQEILPEWMQAIAGVRRGDILPELRDLLEQNFIKEADGHWRLPNANDERDLEILRTKTLLREFHLYVEQAAKPKAKLKAVRVEALRAGFKQCYMDKDFATIVMVAEKIPENLLTEDEVLLQYYDIATSRV